MNNIMLMKPDDWHVHLRQGEMLKKIVGYSNHFGRCLIMPNTVPALDNIGRVKDYIAEVIRCEPEFEPCFTIALNRWWEKHELEIVSRYVTAAKIYPKGVTTNSEEGMTIDEILNFPWYGVMSDNNIVLCVHAEMPGEFSLDRERKMVPVVRALHKRWPSLKIVVEHVTDDDMIHFVENTDEQVAGTITVHHLLLTLDDVIGDKLRPDHFCKPIPKYGWDRERLNKVVMNRCPYFFFGSDSAPHLQSDKYCAQGCAGIFTTPVAIPFLYQLIEDPLIFNDFASINGAKFYGKPVTTETITLVEESWIVPEKAEAVDVNIFWGGKTLRYNYE